MFWFYVQDEEIPVSMLYFFSSWTGIDTIGSFEQRLASIVVLLVLHVHSSHDERHGREDEHRDAKYLHADGDIVAIRYDRELVGVRDC